MQRAPVCGVPNREAESRVIDLVRLLLDQTTDHAVVFTDPEGRLVWLSPGAEHIFGIRSAEAEGQSIHSLFTDVDRAHGLPELEMRIAQSGAPSNDDRWHLRADGSRFWAAGSMVALRNGNGEVEGYCKVIRNRTDHKEQIVRLQNEVDALQDEHEQRNRSLSAIAHELRNPLSPIATATDLLAITDAESGPNSKPIQIIRRQLEMLQRLIDDLMDLSRVATGKFKLELQRIQLQDVVREAVELVHAQIVERNHELELAMPEPPIVLNGDSVRLRQVVVNLLSNAVRYTPPGGRIWASVTIESSEAIVHVRDNGEGIPAEMQARVFDAFTQVRGTGSAGGLGIGLALVKEFVEMHEGSVQVKSDGTGRGSEFIVRLPLPI